MVFKKQWTGERTPAGISSCRCQVCGGTYSYLLIWFEFFFPFFFAFCFLLLRVLSFTLYQLPGVWGNLLLPPDLIWIFFSLIFLSFFYFAARCGENFSSFSWKRRGHIVEMFGLLGLLSSAAVRALLQLLSLTIFALAQSPPVTV